LAAKSSPQGHLSAVKHWLFVRQEALRYALAPVAVTIAFLARLALTPVLGDASPYLLFVPAVLVAAGLGGLGPGLLATGLSVVLGFFVITMSPGVSASEIVDAVLFVMIGAGIAWSGEQLQRNRIRAATSTRDALAREAHLASILNTVPEAMIVIGEDGIVQSFSPAAERLFGYGAAEVIGKNVKMLMPSPYRENHDDYMRRYLRTENGGSSELAASSSASARTARPSRWSWRWEKCDRAIATSSPALSATSRNVSSRRQGYRSCNRSSFMFRD
jgi:two-component system sensor kinase FixL